VRTARAAVRLIWERPSVNVHQRLVMNVAIVTQLATRLASESVRGLGPRLVHGHVIPCLQNTRGLSDTVAHLGLRQPVLSELEHPSGCEPDDGSETLW